MIRKSYLLFVVLVVILSLVSFYPAFNFAFIVDDWSQLWGVFYDRSIIDYYILTQHANSAYEFLALAPFFKFNPFYYQVVGYLLKILTSFIVSLLTLAITQSRKAAFLAGIIFASSIIGIEAFTRISAHNAPLLIISVALGLHFWITAEREKSIYRYLLSILFIILTLLQDPGSGIMILPAIFIWSFLTLLLNLNKNSLRKLFLTTLLLISVLISLKWYLDPRVANRHQPMVEHLSFVLTHPIFTLTNFLTSIGNLTIGWFVPLSENLGLGTANIFSTSFGYLFFFNTIWITFRFLKGRTNIFKILTFLSIWVFLFYLPSWFTQGHYVKLGTISAVSNRYLLIPSIGFIIIISYLLVSLKKYTWIVLGFIIMFNLISSFRILTAESEYRSVEIQTKIYDKIDQDLPKGDEKNKLIIFLGNDPIKIFAIEWNGFYPLAVRRNITEKNDFPTIANNLEYVKKLVCKQQDKAVPDFLLSNLYAWTTLYQNKLTSDPPIINVSDQIRSFIKSDSGCDYNL